MKVFVVISLFFFILSCQTKKENLDIVTLVNSTTMHTNSVHDFAVLNIYGETVSLQEFKGKKLMIVNTASKCGLTPQYKELQSLYEQYKNSGFEIIGFPSNDFLRQEPGTNDEIIAFCEQNYGVTFQMMAKVKVKGSDKHPLFKYLTDKELNGVSDESVSWNFQKFLINEEGKLEKVISPKTSPLDPVVLSWITQ